MRSFSKIQPVARKVRRVAILTHRNGDPDAICSAFALKYLLKRLNPRLSVVIGTPEGVNRLSDQILSRFNIDVELNPDLRDVDLVFTVDTNNLQQLGPLATIIENLNRPVVVIDHHYPHPSMEKYAHTEFCDEKSPSTCEIICKFYRQLGIKPSRREAAALLVGILYETRYLRLATSKTLLTVADLVRRGVKVEELHSFLEVPIDDSERMARIKSAQRSKMLRHGGWIVVTSEVGSHQASAARALIMLGAHLAIVGSEEKNRLRLSLRSTEEFYRDSGIHLGRDVAKPLGDYLHGTGGGHSLAAGVNGSGEVDNALKRCSEMIKELIGKSKGRKHT